jgi:hypothetical protein
MRIGSYLDLAEQTKRRRRVVRWSGMRVDEKRVLEYSLTIFTLFSYAFLA